MARYIDAVKTAEIISEKLNIPLFDLVDIFAEIPTAYVVEVKRGYWKEPMDELKIFKGRYLICSQCNVMLPIITELAAYYYCPNCGAKMDGKALKEREKE